MLLTKWLVVCDQPFDSVEKPEFRELLQYIHRKALKIPKRTTMHRRVMDMGKTAIESTAEMFSVSFNLGFSILRRC
jgi:hypothetical protein